MKAQTQTVQPWRSLQHLLSGWNPQPYPHAGRRGAVAERQGR